MNADEVAEYLRRLGMISVDYSMDHRGPRCDMFGAPMYSMPDEKEITIRIRSIHPESDRFIQALAMAINPEAFRPREEPARESRKERILPKPLDYPDDFEG